MKHLFLYFDNRAAHDMTLLFHLADVRLRHNVNQAVGVRVHLDQKAFKKFEEIVNGEDFLDKLEKARRNSKSAEAREIVSRVLPVANLTSRTVGWSAQERAAEVTKYMAMHRMEGPGQVFYSMAPDDVHNPLCIRLAYPYCGPAEFPAVVSDDFSCNLQQRLPAEDGVRVPPGEPGPQHLTESVLQRLASQNPVATTVVFKHLLANVHTNLIGIQEERKLNQPLERRASKQRGMWGVSACYRDVIECNDRASLHVHGMSHGGLSPTLVADVANDKELREEAMAALDTQVMSQGLVVRVQSSTTTRHCGLCPIGDFFFSLFTGMNL